MTDNKKLSKLNHLPVLNNIQLLSLINAHGLPTLSNAKTRQDYFLDPYDGSSERRLPDTTECVGTRNLREWDSELCSGICCS